MHNQSPSHILLPVLGSSHVYNVGKVSFHVVSMFNGTRTIEDHFADLMVDDLYEHQSEDSPITEEI